jgi:tape measure domain-containing protein
VALNSSQLNLALRITANAKGATTEVGKLKSSISGLSSEFSRLATTAAAALGAGFGAREIIAAADKYATLSAQLKIVADNQESVGITQSALFAISQRTRSDLEGAVGLYTRTAKALRDLGKTEQERLKFTETLNQAIAVSGIGQAEQVSLIRQLSQALGRGVLRGDEFISVMENGPRVAQALADSLNLPIGKITEMAEKGELTAEVLFNALSGQAGKIADEFRQLPETVSGASTRIKNAFLQYVGVTNQATGGTRVLASGLTSIAENFGAIADAAIAAGGVLASVYAGKLAAAFAANARMVASNLAVAASSGRMAIAGKAGGAALGLLGGPIGAITTALSLGALAWVAWGDKAESAAVKAKRAAQDVAQQASDIIERLGKQAQFGSGDLGILSEREEALQREIALLAESSRASEGARQKLTEKRAELARIEQAIESIAQAETKAVGQSVKLNTDWKEIYKERAKGAEKLRDDLRNAFLDSIKAEKDYLAEAKKLRGEASQNPRDSSAEGQTLATLGLSAAELKLQRIKGSAPLEDVRAQAELVRNLASGLDDQARAQEAVNRSKLAEADALDKAAAAERTRQKDLAALEAGAARDLATLEKQVKALEAGAKVPIKLEADGVEQALLAIKAAADSIPSRKVIEIAWSNQGAAKPPGFAYGGILPGYGNGDRRLILAEDGEAITRKEAVAYYGRNFMAQLNAMRLPRFANGGIVSSLSSGRASPSGAGLHPVTLNLPGVGSWPMSAKADVIKEIKDIIALEALKHGRRR